MSASITNAAYSTVCGALGRAASARVYSTVSSSVGDAVSVAVHGHVSAVVHTAMRGAVCDITTTTKYLTAVNAVLEAI